MKRQCQLSVERFKLKKLYMEMVVIAWYNMISMQCHSCLSL
jgi:hypothetical protein